MCAVVKLGAGHELAKTGLARDRKMTKKMTLERGLNVLMRASFTESHGLRKRKK